MSAWVHIPASGPVPYDYEIAQDPVTNAEYAAWLNSLPPEEASKHYCKLMAAHFFGGIEREVEKIGGGGDEVEREGVEDRCRGTVDDWSGVVGGEKVEKVGGGGQWRVGSFVVKDGFEKKPAVFVSWFDAQAYAQAHGGRLPTEAEWKKAAAWMPEEGRLAAWCTGTDAQPMQSEANFYDFENGWALPAPHLADVGWYRPSGAYGCRGMAGNVGEWVDADLPNGWKKALGGSVFRPVENCRAEASEGDHPSKRLSTFGFRIVRAAL